MEVRWKGVSLPYKIFDKDQRVSHAPEAIRGLLLAVQDCCIVKGCEFKVPSFVTEELAKRASLSLN